MNDPTSIEFSYSQTAYMVVVGEGEHSQLPVKDGRLFAFESLFHAAPLADELVKKGVYAQVVPMAIGVLYCLANGQDTELLLMRHDGSFVAIDSLITRTG